MQDSLLYQKFFSSFGSDEDLKRAVQRENTEISDLIKISLYPRFGEEAIYYAGRHNHPEDLSHFLKQKDYRVLQAQFDLIIERLKVWGRNQGTENIDSLNAFITKLKNPSDKITILYADGKKSLETIAVLLDESAIDLELRKALFADLLADNELAKCIDGCYTRIANTAKHLQENRESANQINRWIRSYVGDTAKQTAAKRPFAMPESYQRLLCRVLEISLEANELHASNYLLMKAKEKGIPVENNADSGALEIASKVNSLNKKLIVDLYLKQLESEITASGLVGFIAMRLHNSFNRVLSDTSKNYMDKVSSIENKLNLLGTDSGFLLEEILDAESLTLKPKEALIITIEKRLTEKKWLNAIESKRVQVFNKRFLYYHFSNNIELAWLSEEEGVTRFRFVELLKEDNLDLSDVVKDRLLTTILRLPGCIFEMKDIDTLLNYNSFSIPIASFISLEYIANLLKTNPDPIVFTKILRKLSSLQGNIVLEKITKSTIHIIILNGFSLADVNTRFIDLKPDYFTAHYNLIAQEDALTVTKHLFMQLREKDYRDYSNMGFFNLQHTNYFSDLDFSECDLSNAFVLQAISNTKFDNSRLDYTIFYKKLEDVSFVNVDLRNTIFDERGFEYSEIDLRQARLSTQVFKALLIGHITDFSYTDLRGVNFQEVMVGDRARLQLDFSHANLESINLSELDLRRIKFLGSNLQKTNLFDSQFDNALVDRYVQLQGAHISLYTAYHFHKQGVKKFDGCKIFQYLFPEDIYPYPYIQFQGASFKDALFKRHSFNVEMVDCDLSDVQFIPEGREYSQIINNKYKRTKFINAQFNRIKFEESTFSDCLLQNVILNDVKLPATTLFSFYQHGHRDFNGVMELKGKIPENLPRFPLSEASLSKEAFIHLYRQGVRDFRASNLYSFYLSEILTSQAISEIDLKLEGATYKQSLLGCAGGHSKNKRSTASRCTFHFLVQKPSLVREKQVTLQDMQLLLAEIQTPEKPAIIIKEVTLDHKPLLLLKQPNEISFYWGYQPDEDALIKAIMFTQQSTQPSEREASHLYFYFTKKFAANDAIKVFAKDLRHLGFRQGQLAYYTTQGQLAAVDLQGNFLTVFHNANLDTSFASVLAEENDPNRPKLFAEKKQRSRLYRIAADMKQRGRSSFRAGTREGAQYELGFAVMYFIATWITRKETPELKILDSVTKASLKDYARQIAEEEGEKKLASSYIRNLATRIAVQCIDRGECSNQHLVREDIIDTLNEARPDIQVGYEMMWNKTKALFFDTGDYISKKFDEIKEVFEGKDRYHSQIGNNSDQSLSKWGPRPPFPIFSLVNRDGLVSTLAARDFYTTSMPETTSEENCLFYFEGFTSLSKRKLHNWYDSHSLVHLIKTIELLFDELGYDLNQDADFSEPKLAALIYDFWQQLDNCNISQHSGVDINFLQEKGDLMATGSTSKISSRNRSKRAVAENPNQQILFDESNNIKVATSTGQRPTAWLNTLANYVSSLFLALKKFNPVYSKKVAKPLKKAKFLWSLTPEISAINACKPLLLNRSRDYKQDSRKTNLEFCSPVRLESLNNGLFFANYAVNLTSSFFSAPTSLKKNEKLFKRSNKNVPSPPLRARSARQSVKRLVFLDGHGRNRVPASPWRLHESK